MARMGTKALTRNEKQILGSQQLNVHSTESVQEGFGQPLAPASFLQGVLCRKQVKRWGALERLSQLRNEDLCTVV